MSKKQWEDEILKPTLERYPERKESLLDGRGRPFKLDINLENRIKKISEWSKKTNEYPR